MQRRRLAAPLLGLACVVAALSALVPEASRTTGGEDRGERAVIELREPTGDEASGVDVAAFVGAKQPFLALPAGGQEPQQQEPADTQDPAVTQVPAPEEAQEPETQKCHRLSRRS